MAPPYALNQPTNRVHTTNTTTTNTIVDVVIDPVLGKLLRPHQREGVAFLYDCVMRFKDFEGSGAILADEM